MKKNLLGILLMLAYVSAGYAQITYFDFDATVPVIANSGATYSLVDNPFKDAVNGSDKVGKFVTGPNNYSGIVYTFAQPLDLRADTVFTILTYNATLTGQSRIQIQGTGMTSTNLAFLDYTTPGAWQEQSFSIPKSFDTKIQKVLIIFANNRSVAGEEWYFDLFKGPNVYPAPKVQEPRTYYNSINRRPAFTVSDGAIYSVAANPEYGFPNNPYVEVGKMTKGTSANSSLSYTLPAGVSFTASQLFKMNVYSASTGNVSYYGWGYSYLC